MKLDILFINCYSYEFVYIPMGTFGLCDYLTQYGIKCKILNLSLYTANEYIKRLIDWIDQTQPKYIGIILHWKELFSNFVKIGSFIKHQYPSIKLITGGITASYFATQLIKNFDFIDYIIHGDAELPLLKLISSSNAYDDSLENLVFMNENGHITDNRGQYILSSEVFNSISFAELDYLIDYEKYIKQINQKLGFPISIGRGCYYNCSSCGGSRFAFKKHSNRTDIIIRHSQVIVDDLIKLYTHYGVDTILLSHTDDTSNEILRTIENCTVLKKNIIINLECWSLPNRGLLNLFKRVTKLTQESPPILLISPETTSNVDRRIIKDKKLFYSNQQLQEIIELIRKTLKGFIVSIFYSYPHITHISADKLYNESENIYNLRYRLSKKINDINFHYMTLSSDPASILNEKESSIESSIDLQAINNSILFDRNLASNLLLHRPKSLSNQEINIFERVKHFEDLIRYSAPYIYCLFAVAFGYHLLYQIMEEASSYYYYDYKGISNELTKSNTALALHLMKRVIQHMKDIQNDFTIQLLDLFIFFEVSKRLKRIEPKIDNINNNYIPNYLTLNQDKYFISDYNFRTIIALIQKWKTIDKKILNMCKKNNEQTLYLFIDNSIVPTNGNEIPIFKFFNGINKTSEIVKMFMQKKNKSNSFVVQRIRYLYEAGILI